MNPRSALWRPEQVAAVQADSPFSARRDPRYARTTVGIREIPTDADATSAAAVNVTAVILADRFDRTSRGTSATSAGTGGRAHTGRYALGSKARG